MRFFSTLLAVAAATGAIASPLLERDASTAESRGLVARDDDSTAGSAFTPSEIGDCLQPSQATNIVNAFLYLLANPMAPNFNATAKALFTKDLMDTSDSIDQLAGIPVRFWFPFSIPPFQP